MTNNRRSFLKTALIISSYTSLALSGLLKTGSSFANWSEKQFAPGTLPDTILTLYQGETITETDKIHLKLPRIAENGAVVPITVTSSMENVQNIDILVEKNPVPLAARFELFPDTDPFVSGRLKMAETCDVIAVVRADGKLYSNRKKVKVTIGGCGG